MLCHVFIWSRIGPVSVFMQRTVKMYISGIETFVSVKKLWQTIDSEIMIISFVFLPDFNPKMPQSGIGSMQEKNTGNMPSAMCPSSMNKALDPTPI